MLHYLATHLLYLILLHTCPFTLYLNCPFLLPDIRLSVQLRINTFNAGHRQTRKTLTCEDGLFEMFCVTSINPPRGERVCEEVT